MERPGVTTMIMTSRPVWWCLCVVSCVWIVPIAGDGNNNTKLCFDLYPDLPLLLTPMIEKNQTAQARSASLVDHSFLEDFVPPSHAGYFTVDPVLRSHMFFWFFPSQSTNSTAPLVLWLNGGPTLSSMLGLFHENGPMELHKSANTSRPIYTSRRYSWTSRFSMLYVDNPVNVGFSHSESGEKGDTFTQHAITKNLYSVLQQFLVVFPEYRDRQLYIGGQSYAGMYTISLAHYIHTHITNGKTDVHLTGIYLGGPYFDPENQISAISEFHHHIGYISYSTMIKHKEMLANLWSFLPRLTSSTATDTNDNNDDYDKNMDSSNINKVSSVKLHEVFRVLFAWENQNNFVTMDDPPYAVINDLMNRLDMKRAVHAGRHTEFHMDNGRLVQRFTLDAITSRRKQLGKILDNYKVLIFNGDLDGLIPSASIEASLMNTPWVGQEEYINATRNCLLVWGETNNYYKKLAYFSSVRNFCRVVVPGAGHQTPYDRPETTLRMMEDFVTHGCIRERGEYEDVDTMDVTEARIGLNIITDDV